MKNIIKNITLCGCLVLGMGMTSCEDMMTVDTGDKAYINANDTLYSYLGIMRAMQDVAERQIVLGEIRGDLVSSSEYATDTLHAISNFENPKDQSCSMLCVSDYYNVINNCNFYIYNCDTSTVRANVKYMIPEYTQVKAIRAWAYLQLVKNYKEVPYITEPVKNLDVIKNFDYSHNLVNKDNLIDKLLEDGLAGMVDTNYPQYGKTGQTWGNWNNGSVNISARNCFIPIRLVLADAYLLRGADKSDYENAAFYYYSFLRKEDVPMPRRYMVLLEDEDAPTGYDLGSYSSGTQWGQDARSYIYDKSNDVITVIPSSANAGLGKMLTRVAEVFGYNPSSIQATVVSGQTENEDGTTTTEYSAAGAIMVNPTYKRQYFPSYAYEDVNLSQKYVQYTNLENTKDEKILKYYDQQDARINWAINSTQYEGEKYSLCGKVASKASFFYTIPIYRKGLIWLRLAESLNRAGYPEFAFAILKDGINNNTLPTLKDVTSERLREFDGITYNIWTIGEDTVYSEIGEKDPIPLILEDGVLVPYTGNKTGAVLVTDKERKIVYNAISSMYYVTDSLKLKKFESKFNFRDDIWEDCYGIHAIGGGFSYRMNMKSSAFSMWGGDYITTNISGYRDTMFYDYKKLIEKKLDKKTFNEASEDEIIDAVEDIIVDELALETCFEGNRFYDLVRIAEHKNQSGFKGTEWLAKKIANRGTKQATKNSPAVDGFDAALYSKLQNQNLWYFTLPAWK